MTVTSIRSWPLGARDLLVALAAVARRRGWLAPCKPPDRVIRARAPDGTLTLDVGSTTRTAMRSLSSWSMRKRRTWRPVLVAGFPAGPVAAGVFLLFERAGATDNREDMG